MEGGGAERPASSLFILIQIAPSKWLDPYMFQMWELVAAGSVTVLQKHDFLMQFLPHRKCIAKSVLRILIAQVQNLLSAQAI